MRFWVDKWVGGVALREVFPRLFFVAANKESKISENGRFVEGVWMWDFQWRRQIIFQREETMICELIGFIGDVQLGLYMPDMLVWNCDTSRAYTVKSAYDFLVDNGVVLALRRMWKTLVPKKVSLFSWQLLLQALQVHKELVKCDMLFLNESCVLCNYEDEEVNHLFLHFLFLTVYGIRFGIG
uniref:Reverse transcriptase zinc-binding domain-containing protein n=1 Tax=Cajanus cajan TaxID=3821 RepID=A0A151TIB3_CAJCA|nr:hypothetical protein KK1_013079 [Cajanus cajan]